MPRRSSLLFPAALAAVLSCSPCVAQGRATADYFEGIGLLKRELHEEAAAKFRRFVQRAPRDERVPEAWYRIGTCELALDRRDRAIEAFGRALADPQAKLTVRAECRYRLGNALRAAERPSDAAEQFARLLDEQKDDHYLAVAARYALAESLRAARDRDGAVREYLAVANRDGSAEGTHAAPALYHAGYLLLDLEKAEAAAGAFSALVKRFAKHDAAAESRLLIGESWFQAGKFQAAEQAFEVAARAGGEFADDGRIGVAWSRVERGDVDGAIEHFRRLVREHARSELVPTARIEIGRLQLGRGNAKAASAEIQRALAALQDPSALELRLDGLELLGLAQLELGQADVARQAFEQALKSVPGDGAELGLLKARLLFGRGEALADAEQWQPALESYGAATAAIAGDDAEAVALRGDALYGQALSMHKLGDFKGSTERARELLQLPGAHRLARHADFAIGENAFSTKQWAAAATSYAKVPADHPLARRASFKRAWCAYLQDDRKSAVQRFAALIGDGAPNERDAIAEESVSMVALANLGIPAADAALAAADRYRAEHPNGKFLARTERVAAQVLTSRGELRAAASRLERAAKASADPTQAAADQLQRAELAFREDDFEGARGIYRKLANRSDSIGARAIEGAAWCAFELGDDEVASRSIAAGLDHPKGAPQKAGLLELRIALEHRQKRWPAAIATAREFLRQFGDHPSTDEVRYGLGVALSRAEQLPEARTVLADLGKVEGYAKRARVFYELGWAARRAKDEPAALAAFGNVVRFGGKADTDLVGEARLHLGVAALDAKKRDAALPLLTAAQGKYRPQALYRAGFALLEDQPEAAKKPLLELVGMGKEQPLYHEALFLIGEAESALGDHRGAVTRYRELLRDVPEHERADLARLHLGQSAVRTEQFDLAVAALSEFLAAPEPKGEGDQVAVAKAQRAEAYLWRGRAQSGRKDHVRAEADFGAVLERTESVLAAEAQYRIGSSRRARGDLSAAAEAYVKLPIFYADGDWVRRGLYEAGRCYRELNQLSKARKLWQELVNRFPKSAEAKQAQKDLAQLGGGDGGEGGK